MSLGVLRTQAYNFCLLCLGSCGYFATEEKEKNRGIREKIKKLKEKRILLSSCYPVKNESLE
jgi:hypothetical protein